MAPHKKSFPGAGLVSAGRRTPAQMHAELAKIAADRGGALVSSRYTRAKNKLRWRCAKGHEFKMTPSDVRAGKWCPPCVGRLPPAQALAELRAIARQRGGALLSQRYTRANDKLRWRCAEGHVWEAPATDIRSGRWCGRCAGNVRGSIEDCRAIARERGGECLSSRYLNAKHPLRWRCAAGHEWRAAPTCVKSGTWCPVCARGPHLTIDDMRGAAAARGGECLSKTFEGSAQILRWRCAEGHEWDATGTAVYTIGSWCHICWGKAKGTIEQMRDRAAALGGECLSDTYVDAQTPLRFRCGLGHEFDKRPVSINMGSFCPYCMRRGAKGIGDMLLEELAQVARDHGGECLSSEYFDQLTMMRWRCQVGHEWDASAAQIRLGNWCPECAHTRRPKLEEIQALARERGGRCLSDRYVNGLTKMLFECGVCWHRWWAMPTGVRQGTWCPECARARKGERTILGIEDMEELAEAHGGECLSTEYTNLKTPLVWRCRSGHEWEAPGRSVRGGAWCPICTGRVPLTIEDMQRDAAERGGRCLSERYFGNRIKLEWECGEGHRWWATPQLIRHGSWCPVCWDKTPDAGLARAYALAQQRGGLCLSSRYPSRGKRLRWRCASGHEWRANEASVAAGRWCPRCPDDGEGERNAPDPDA